MKRGTGPEYRAKIHAGGASVRRLAACAQCQKQPAIACEFADRVVPVISAVNGFINIIESDRNSMWAVENNFTPYGPKGAILVEDHHRMLTAVEYVNAIVPVRGHAGNFR